MANVTINTQSELHGELTDPRFDHADTYHFHDDFHGPDVTASHAEAAATADFNRGVLTADGETYDLEGRLKDLEKAKDRLERAKERTGNTPREIREYEKEVANMETALKKDFKGSARAVERAHKSSDAAIKDLDRELKDRRKELRDALKEEKEIAKTTHAADPAAREAALNELERRNEKLERALDKHYEKKIEFHTERQEKLGQLTKDFEEHTGLRAADFSKTAKEAEKTASAATKGFGQVWKGSNSAVAKVGFVGGIAAFLHGGSKLLGSGGQATNPDGSPAPDNKTGAMVETLGGAGVTGLSWANMVKEAKAAAQIAGKVR